MKILQTVKYYAPSKGGMESVVKNLVEGVLANVDDVRFTVYANSHLPSFKKAINVTDRLISIKESTPFFFKSQPLNLRYSSLRALIKDADIIHHHYPFPNMELALFRNMDLLDGKDLVITWHANIKNSRWSWIGKFYDPLISKLLIKAKMIVVTSPQLLEASDILKPFANKIIVIPLSFDPNISSYQVKPKRYPVDRVFQLLFVGKLRIYKGLKYLIEAIKDLDVNLVISGEGESEVELKKYVSDLGINNKINFLGKVNDEELKSLYKKSDLFILPSINEAEAFGVVQLEAMTNAIPVINTNLKSGVPFVSLHNFSGLTIQPANSLELKHAIESIIHDKSLYEKFSRNSLERAKLFSRDKMVAAYIGIYNKNL